MPTPVRRPSELINPAVYRNVFEDHPEGRQILEELITRFSRPHITDGGIDAVLKTYTRAGARSVIDYIVARINMANGVTPDETEQE